MTKACYDIIADMVLYMYLSQWLDLDLLCACLPNSQSCVTVLYLCASACMTLCVSVCLCGFLVGVACGLVIEALDSPFLDSGFKCS